MSVIIIGGGDGVRQALTNLENASVHWTNPQREAGETLLKALEGALSQVALHGNADAVTIAGP